MTTFPELADLVAADLYAGSALWRYPELDTCVLRMCYTLGPSRVGHAGDVPARRSACRWCSASIRSSSSCTRTTRPTPICVALEKQLRGVYNVAGPQPMPLSSLIRAAGRTPVPVPEIVLKLAFGRFGLPALPPGAVAHLKFPVVIDDSSFRTATGYTNKYDEDQTIAAFRSVAG